METQSGVRTPLVDPFGRELEEWLRDAPATRAPYVSDLVVPPVTGPVQRPDAVDAAPADAAPSEVESIPAGAVAEQAEPTSDQAFRRPRDHGRHRSVCAPSFPEPPERIALRIEELAVEVSAQNGRPTLERITVLEGEILRRDEDLARLTAWEATVAHLDDPEVEAARAYARSVFADLLADAADEADRRDRAAARRIATGTVSVVPTVHAPEAAATVHAPQAAAPADTAVAAAPVLVLPAVAAPVSFIGAPALDDASADRDEPARLVPSLQAVTPVSANTRPTPLIQPATGPTVIDRDAFAAVLRSHRGEAAATPVVFPEALAPTEAPDAPAAEAAPAAQPGWRARTLAAVLRLFGRR